MSQLSLRLGLGRELHGKSQPCCARKCRRGRATRVTALRVATLTHNLDKSKGETRRAGRADPEKAEGAELTPKFHSVRKVAGLVKRTPGQQKNGERRVNPGPQTPLCTTKKMVCWSQPLAQRSTFTFRTIHGSSTVSSNQGDNPAHIIHPGDTTLHRYGCMIDRQQ